MAASAAKSYDMGTVDTAMGGMMARSGGNVAWKGAKGIAKRILKVGKITGMAAGGEALGLVSAWRGRTRRQMIATFSGIKVMMTEIVRTRKTGEV